MIKSKNLILKLQNKTILHDVTCHIPKGKITTFIGNSGGGKTSLLKCMATLYQDYQGDIVCDGADLKKQPAQQRAQLVGFVFQQFHLFPHMTVLQNCMHPMQSVLKLSAHDAQQKSLMILGMLGMASLKDAKPAQLSGGQQQRVAIARALCMGPQVLILDEPTSALDPQNAKLLRAIFKDLAKAGITIVVSSHDMAFVRDISEIIYFVEQGKIVEMHDVVQDELDSESKIGLFLNYDVVN